MLSKEVTKIIETAVLNGNEVKITVEIGKEHSATRSRQLVNKSVTVPPPPPPPRSTLGKDNPFMPERPSIRYVNEGGCLSFITLSGITIGTILYIL